MTRYCEDKFYYDSVKIRRINKNCHRYADRCLWDNDESTEYDGDDIIADNPPISTYDIALLQATLSHEMDLCFYSKPVAASISVEWRSNRIDSTHHVARFDMTNHNVDMFMLSEQERLDWRNEVQKMRGAVDTYFDRIASVYTAHQLGWLNVPLETALYGIPDGIHHSGTQIKLPTDYGTLMFTVVSTVDTGKQLGHYQEFTTEGILERVRRHFDAFQPKAKASR